MSREDDNSSLFPVLRSQLCCRPDGADQAIQYFPQLSGLVEQLLAVFRSEVGEVLGDHQLSFNLDQ